jgi:hypothetical protein
MERRFKLLHKQAKNQELQAAAMQQDTSNKQREQLSSVC